MGFEELLKDISEIKTKAIIGILLCIFVFGILFESSHEFLLEFLKHRNLHYFIQIISAIFKELTILGFLSFCLFSFTRFGVIMELNNKYLGPDRVEITGIKELSEERENPYTAPTPLFALLERIHIFLFTLMIVFILTVLLTFHFSAIQAMRWKGFEQKDLSAIVKDIDSPTGMAASMPLIHFWMLSYRMKHPASPLQQPLEEHASFAEYLVENTCEILVQAVRMSPATWVGVLPTVIFFRIFADLPILQLTVALLTTGVLICILKGGLYIIVKSQVQLLYPEENEVKQYMIEIRAGNVAAQVPDAKITRTALLRKNKTLSYIFGRPMVFNRQDCILGIPGFKISYVVSALTLLLFTDAIAITAILKVLIMIRDEHNLFSWATNFLCVLAIFTILGGIMLLAVTIPEIATLSCVGTYGRREKIEASHLRNSLKIVERQLQIIEFLQGKASSLIPGFKDTEDPAPSSLLAKRYEGTFRRFADIQNSQISKKNMLCLLETFGILKEVPHSREKLEIRMRQRQAADPLEEEAFDFDSFVKFMSEIMEETQFLNSKQREAIEEENTKQLVQLLDPHHHGFITVEDLMQHSSGLNPEILYTEAKSLSESIMGTPGTFIKQRQLLKWLLQTKEKYHYLQGRIESLSHSEYSHE